MANRDTDQGVYIMDVYTGVRGGAGTAANVFIMLHGEDEQTEPIVLMDGIRKVGNGIKL